MKPWIIVLVLAILIGCGFVGFSLIKWAKSINEPDPASVRRSSWERRILMMPKGGEAELLYIDLDDDVAVVRAGDWINPKEFGEKDSDGLRRWLKDKVAPCYWYPGGSGRIVGCTNGTYEGRESELREAILRIAK